MEKIAKNKNIILIIIGTLLIVLSFCLLSYDKFELIKSSVFDDIEMEKYRELNKNQENEIIDEEENLIDEVVVEEVTEKEEQSKKEETKKTQTQIKKEIIGYLEISKINLKQGLVSKNSYYNNVNRNIQILNASDYPDKDKGNVILAAHSGSSYLSFFRNLYQLSLGDEAKIYYKNKVYTYNIVDIYNVPKVGKVTIKRDYDKSCLTLITCTKNSKTEQTVYILELTSLVEDGGKHD